MRFIPGGLISIPMPYSISGKPQPGFETGGAWIGTLGAAGDSMTNIFMVKNYDSTNNSFDLMMDNQENFLASSDDKVEYEGIRLSLINMPATNPRTAVLGVPNYTQLDMKPSQPWNRWQLIQLPNNKVGLKSLDTPNAALNLTLVWQTVDVLNPGFANTAVNYIVVKDFSTATTALPTGYEYLTFDPPIALPKVYFPKAGSNFKIKFSNNTFLWENSEGYCLYGASEADALTFVIIWVNPVLGTFMLARSNLLYNFHVDDGGWLEKQFINEGALLDASKVASSFRTAYPRFRFIQLSDNTLILQDFRGGSPNTFLTNQLVSDYSALKSTADSFSTAERFVLYQA